MEYQIWCDESDRKGVKYANFYGGAIVHSGHVTQVINSLEDKKISLGMFGEVKWSKVSKNYLEKYKMLIDEFFILMKAGKIKTRVMFTQNRIQPIGLSKEQKEAEYFLLYYQFIKHAFGLMQAPYHEIPTNLRINFDKIPDKKEKSDTFKSYILGLNKHLKVKNISLVPDNISEVVSHKHVILQCVDIVTGAMSFKLNKKHLVKPHGQRLRGKKTVAKENLYIHINGKIRELYPAFMFNIGVSTGWHEGEESLWSMPYRHWHFVPKKSKIIRGD